MQELRKDEQGFSLLEMLLSISIEAVLALVGMMIFVSSVNLFISGISDWEMTEEVRQIAQQIRDNVRYADSITTNESSVIINTANAVSGEKATIVYKIYNTDSNYRLYRNGQPLNGSSKLGNVQIRKFRIEKKGDNIVHLIIEGTNSVNDHKFDLETDILCYAIASKKEI